jgi:DNA-binding transcriptional MocR family regulator
MSYQGLSLGSKLLWARLAQYAGQDGACFPSQQRLAADLGVSVRQIQRYLSELVSKQFLEKEKPAYKDQIQGKTTKYFFLQHPVLGHDKSDASGATDLSCGSRQICRVGHDKSVAQRESEKEKNEKGSSTPDFQESQKKARGILKQLAHGGQHA